MEEERKSYFDIEIPKEEEAAEKKGLFGRLASGLSKTRKALMVSLDQSFGEYEVFDDDFYEELEDIMVMADIGATASAAIIEDLRTKVNTERIKDPKACRI